MEIGFEERGLDVEIKMHTGLGGAGYTNANFSFRPDIVVHPYKNREDNLHLNTDKKWSKPEDSIWVILEAETNPRNIFSNVLKLEAYRKIGEDHDFGKKTYSFILVTFADQRTPIDERGMTPFDEVWLFDRDGKNRHPEIIRPPKRERVNV